MQNTDLFHFLKFLLDRGQFFGPLVDPTLDDSAALALGFQSWGWIHRNPRSFVTSTD